MSDPTFAYRDGELHVEQVPLRTIAERFGTPVFVYSRAALESAWREYDAAFAGTHHLVCYAMKANSNLAVIQLFAALGSGFDIVSGGELARVVAAGGDPAKVVFSGVGKTAAEIALAIEAGILCFNVESTAELARLEQVAAGLRRQAPVSIRVNPDVDPRTHPYISTGLRENKFGVAFDDALDLYRRAAGSSRLVVRGIDMHIGSQITELAPFVDATSRLAEFVDRLAAEGIEIDHIDLGGGVGIRYGDEQAIELGNFASVVRDALGPRARMLVLEPGRRLVGNAGVLLTRVEYLKHSGARNFAIVDAAMTELIRPALYDAWHEIRPVRPRPGTAAAYDVVGPVCESADFLGRDRSLALAEGDLLAVMSAGAYAMAMASNYNTRPRPCEIVVDGDQAHVVRVRERVEDLFAAERTLPGAPSPEHHRRAGPERSER